MNVASIKPHDTHLRGTNPAKAGPLTEHEQLVRKTEKWVSQTFFGTLLKHMHDGPFKSDLLEGGKGGKAFTEMYDQQLADRMSRGAGAKLVNAIVRRIEAKAAYHNSGKATQRAPAQANIPKDSRRAHLSSLLPGKIAHAPAADHAEPSLHSHKQQHPHGLGAKAPATHQSIAHLI